jgi:hypothetical protein
MRSTRTTMRSSWMSQMIGQADGLRTMAHGEAVGAGADHPALFDWHVRTGDVNTLAQRGRRGELDLYRHPGLAGALQRQVDLGPSMGAAAAGRASGTGGHHQVVDAEDFVAGAAHRVPGPGVRVAQAQQGRHQAAVALDSWVADAQAAGQAGLLEQRALLVRQQGPQPATVSTGSRGANLGTSRCR